MQKNKTQPAEQTPSAPEKEAFIALFAQFACQGLSLISAIMIAFFLIAGWTECLAIEQCRFAAL